MSVRYVSEVEPSADGIRYYDWRYSLYTLRDEDGNVRYVGLTTQEPIARLSGHKSSKGPVGDWVRREIDAGRTVTIYVEEEIFGNGANNSQAYAAEKEYILGYSNLLGDRLLNRMSVPKKTLLQVAYADENIDDN